jgi:hypothetical protein
MLRFPAKILLFATAYTPFAILILIKNELMPPWWTMSTCLAVFVAAVGVTYFILMRIRRTEPALESVIIEEENTVESLSYLMTYMIPLIVELKDTRSAIFLLAQLAIIFLFYVNSDLIRHNMLFGLLGYRIYKFKISSSTRFLLVKGNLEPGTQDLRLRKVVSNGIWLAEQNDDPNPE